MERAFFNLADSLKENSKMTSGKNAQVGFYKRKGLGFTTVNMHASYGLNYSNDHSLLPVSRLLHSLVAKRQVKSTRCQQLEHKASKSHSVHHPAPPTDGCRSRNTNQFAAKVSLIAICVLHSQDPSRYLQQYLRGAQGWPGRKLDPQSLRKAS